MCTNEEKFDLSTEYANSLNSEEEVSANKHTCSQTTGLFTPLSCVSRYFQLEYQCYTSKGEITD